MNNSKAGSSVFAFICCLALTHGRAEAQVPAQPSSAVSKSGQVHQLKPFVFNVPGLHYADDIPINFPVPAYTSNVTRKRFLNTTKGPAGASAVIYTRDKPENVYNWYKDKLKSDQWLVKTPNPETVTKAGKGKPLYIIEALKERNEVFIACNLDKKTSGTHINLNWVKTKK